LRAPEATATLKLQSSPAKADDAAALNPTRRFDRDCLRRKRAAMAAAAAKEDVKRGRREDDEEE